MGQVTHRLRETTAASEASQLRIRGTHMLELATRAYCERHYDFARLLTRLASEIFAHARDAEESRALCPVPVARKSPRAPRR
jgi:hypothetical protein